MAASTQPLAGVVFQNTTSTELDGVWPLPFWKDTIDSSSNYQNFLCWGANYASKQELASTADLNSVSHRDPFTASGFASPLAASFPNGKKHFPWRPCQQFTCRRCTTLEGGWKWKWVGPWTSDACHIDDMPSRAALHRRCNLPWPQGLLEGPPHDAQTVAANLPVICSWS